MKTLLITTVLVVSLAVLALYFTRDGKGDNHQEITIMLTNKKAIGLTISHDSEIVLTQPGYMSMRKGVLSLRIKSHTGDITYIISHSSNAQELQELREAFDFQRPMSIALNKYNINNIEWEYIFNPAKSDCSAYARINDTTGIFVAGRVDHISRLKKYLSDISIKYVQ